eukprot:m.964239 g.964239  ORF g.964239 m.964239 type:complete len:93 (-) comp436896_c0_seq1:40-318(-)
MPYDTAIVVLLAIGVWQLYSIHQRLNQQAAQLQALMRHLGVTPGQLTEPTEDIKALARQPARRIEAIKAYRQQTGASLKDAKDVIDRVAASG